MSHSKHHFLALLPLFSILSMSPAVLETHHASRSIASDEVVVASAHPKYEARAAKIDRSKIEIDKDLDLSCFSERGEALRKRLMDKRKEYKVDEVDKDKVAVQRAHIEGLISSMVDLEVDFKALKDKKAFEVEGEKIADGTINELKTTLESLLIDEMENELNVLKAEQKPEVVVETKPEVKPEAKPDAKPQSDADKLCELEEKNKVLSKQVEDLLAQQKTIMETMLGMNKMMVQMNSQMQQQQQIPQWLLSGSMMNPQFQYPYNQGSSTVIIVGGNGAQSMQPQQGFIGNSAYAGAYQYQQPQQQNSGYLPQNNQLMEYDPRFQTQPVMPGPFGNAPFSYNFGPTPFNQAPIQSA